MISGWIHKILGLQCNSGYDLLTPTALEMHLPQSIKQNLLIIFVACYLRELQLLENQIRVKWYEIRFHS
jgi:hypothetical protein